MNCSSIPLGALFACLALLPPPSRAEVLPAIGPLYPIAEENALDTILKRLKEKERSGELERSRRAAIARSLESARHPPPVEGLGTTRVRARRTLDPTVHYTQAITTDEGAIVVPAGATINPLLITALSERLVFFDGRDPAQAEAVRRLIGAARGRIKPILVAGAWYALSKAWKTQVYYDQAGRLSRRFGVRAVPTVISQQGPLLLLEEIPAEELR